MSLRRGKEELSVMEAMDILSNMSEIDLKVVQDEEIEEEIGEEINWRDPRQALLNEAGIKETFRVLHRYLQNIVRKDPASLQDPQIQKGIQAIMLLAKEAVQKMDKYAALYPKMYKQVSKLKEYTDLEKYYRQQILHQMPKPKETPEEWEEDIQDGFESIEAQKRGLRDLEAVRQDLNYELFFIKSENDKPYYSRNLLRHIRLVGNFDELVSRAEGEDPLLHMRELLDQELFEGAKEALKLAAPYIDEFYKEGMQHKNRPYVGSLNKAVMALRMAANPKNLIENQSFKSCLEYYGDFHRFLRAAMQAPGYIDRIEGDGTDSFSHALLNLTHALCCFYFMRIEPRRGSLKLIHEMIEQGDELRGPRPRSPADDEKLQLWNDLLDEDESIRYLLKHYPNGPIFRTLDAFREEEEFEGYDPLTHFNFPSQLFTFSCKGMHVTVLRLPCPIKQVYINRAHLVEEFTGFVRYYKHELKPDKHLLINMQDRTSWEEFSRCRALEEGAQKAEHYEVLYTLGLSKNGDFYTQMDEYQSVGGAPIFLEQFKDQILSGADCGFHFPDLMKDSRILEDFVDPAFRLIHTHFFEERSTLTRKEKLCFIEIFYLLFTLKALEIIGADSISFTCKDALDTGLAQTALFYGFLRMLSSPKAWTKEEKDFLLWLLYSPALLVRDRAINKPRFQRALMALEHIHAQCLKNHDAIVKEVNALFKAIHFPLEIKFR